MTRFLPLLVFPIGGSLLAWVFRPSELDVQTLQPPVAPQPYVKVVALPDGQALHMIGIPDPAGGPAFYLSETEIPSALWRSFSPQAPSHKNAIAFCSWLTDQTGMTFRLPTSAEWQLAAAGGLANAEYPWGYGSTLPKGIHFNLPQAPSTPGAEFGYGFKDFAGGRWEWTQEGHLLGSAWSETNPQTLRLDFEWHPPANYAGADVSIRVLLEAN
jgi:hypothetical protein